MRAITILSAALLVMQCHAADDDGKKTDICFAILRPSTLVPMVV